MRSLLASIALACLPAVAAAEELQITGTQAVRPMVGVSAFLDVDTPTPLGGNKFLFGADYIIGDPTGMALVFGLHLGSGDRALLLMPVAEVHYRFDLRTRIVPYIGGGLSARLATSSALEDVHIGGSARFVAGADYFIREWAAISAQVTIPDLGAQLAPARAVIGTVEWTLGPHFRL